MTLAQNLQQLLNGNKNSFSFKILFLSCISLLIFSSCDVLKGTQSNYPRTNPQQGEVRKIEKEETKTSTTTDKKNESKVVEKEPEKEDNKPSKPKNDTTIEPDTIINIVEPTPTGGILTNYNVLVILPFNTQKNSLGYEDQKIDTKSKVALEFYQGFLQSLRELKQDGFNITIKVYDTKSDQYRTKSLLNSTYEKYDLVIGPAYTKCLKEAAEWARENKTYLVSPIASKADFIQENPYFVALNPTVNSHIAKLVQYIKSTKRVNNVTIIANPNSGRDAKLVESLQRQLSSYGGVGDFNTNTSVNLVYDTGDDDTDLTNYLTQFIDNHVIVASMDEAFASNAVRRLKLVNTQYPVVLYGMYNWRKFKNINIDYLENMNLHISTVTADDDNDYEQQNMINDYKLNVGIAPSEFSKRGYDVGKYLFEAMNENGANLIKALPLTGMESGKFMDFYVRAARASNGKTRMLENTAVKMIEFENYEFRLAR